MNSEEELGAYLCMHIIPMAITAKQTITAPPAIISITNTASNTMNY
jgi:hypothetical protein